jgi:hypothetical protein
MTEWTHREPGLRQALAETRSLWRRAMARKAMVLAFALTATLGLVARQNLKLRSYESRVVFRVVEADIDAKTAPSTARKLRDYVLDTVFSSERLFDVMRAHDLYRDKLKKNPQLALEAMRDDITVEVWRNYFIEAREQGDAGRTARLSISYKAPDREKALEVVQHLGRLFAEVEEKGRIAIANRAAKDASDALDMAREELIRRRRDLVLLQTQLQRGGDPAKQASLRIDSQNLTKNIAGTEERLHKLQENAATLEFRAALERQHLGLRFEVVDPGELASAGLTQPTELLLVTLLGLLILFPICALTVGAFDSRVYTLDDIRRLGIHPLGVVRRSPSALK